KEVENLIYTYNVPTPPNMFPTSVLNVGTLRNSGIELLLRSDILKKSDFGVNATLTLAHNANEVVSLSNNIYKLEYADVGYIGDSFQTNTHRLVPGEAVGNFWGYEFRGFGEDGKWRFDSLGTAVSSGNALKKVIGNGIPKMIAGLTIGVNYRNLDVSLL